MSFKRRGDAEEAKAALHDTDYEGYRMVTRASHSVVDPIISTTPLLEDYNYLYPLLITRATAW